MRWGQQHALALRRLPYLKRVKGSVLAQCWQAPLQYTSNDWRRCSFLACDAEMSSLEVEQGELLSLGWVAIDAGSVPLATAEHHLLRPHNSVGQSATIHQLRDCEFDEALEPQAVAERFLAAAAGRVLVFHNANLDLAFLDRACRQLYGAPLLLPYVDTLQLEHRALLRRDIAIKSGDLRLQACRSRYNLPDYPAHNALVDAVATAELLLAQLAAGASV